MVIIIATEKSKSDRLCWYESRDRALSWISHDNREARPKFLNRGEIPQSECDAVYDYLIAGTMTISLEGCGYYCFLVITGATRGQVWFNADVGDGGYHPLNLSFLDWYEQWLDEYFYL